MLEAEFIYNTVSNNGMKSTAEFQMDLIKNKKMEEENSSFNQELKEISSQENQLGLLFTK